MITAQDLTWNRCSWSLLLSFYLVHLLVDAPPTHRNVALLVHELRCRRLPPLEVRAVIEVVALLIHNISLALRPAHDLLNVCSSFHAFGN